MKQFDISHVHTHTTSGLHDGLAGQALVLQLKHFLNTGNNALSSDVLSILDSLIQKLNYSQNLGGHVFHSSGYSGIGCAVELLNSLDEPIKELSDLLAQIDHIIITAFRNSIAYKNFKFDPLHGIPGAALYALYRQKKNQELVDQIIKPFLKLLSKEIVEGDNGALYILHNYERSSSKAVNFSLSHGLSGITFLLLLLHERRVADTSYIVNGFCEFICQRIDFFKSFGESYGLPHADIDVSHKSESRLAWCYGDLGVANILLKAGRAFSNEKFYDYGLNLVHRCANRNVIYSKDQELESFCHGYPGVAYMFKRIGRYIGVTEISERGNYWLKYFNTVTQGMSEDDILNKSKLPIVFRGSILYGSAGSWLADYAEMDFPLPINELLFTV